MCVPSKHLEEVFNAARSDDMFARIIPLVVKLVVALYQLAALSCCDLCLHDSKQPTHSLQKPYFSKRML